MHAGVDQIWAMLDRMWLVSANLGAEFDQLVGFRRCWLDFGQYCDDIGQSWAIFDNTSVVGFGLG